MFSTGKIKLLEVADKQTSFEDSRIDKLLICAILSYSVPTRRSAVGKITQDLVHHLCRMTRQILKRVQNRPTEL